MTIDSTLPGGHPGLCDAPGDRPIGEQHCDENQEPPRTHRLDAMSVARARHQTTPAPPLGRPILTH